jgi:hypothetical protein
MTEDKYSITSRIEKALYDSGQQPIINEKVDRDLKRARSDIEEMNPRLRALEYSETKRFTREQAVELFKELFKVDIKERAALSKLVHLIYVPIGVAAAGRLHEGRRSFFK